MRIAIVAATGLALAAGPALAHSPDPTKLPLGDGKLSSGPKAGFIWACHTDPGRGGAQHDGPWIDKAAGTWDMTKKVAVEGAVTWPHSFSVRIEGDRRVITLNDLPDYPTGIFPIQPSDPAYRYDTNPNHIGAQSMQIALPVTPQAGGAADVRAQRGRRARLRRGAVQRARRRRARRRRPRDPGFLPGPPAPVRHLSRSQRAGLPARRPIPAAARRSCSATPSTASASTARATRTARSSPRPISTSATGAPARSSGTASRWSCTTTSPRSISPTRSAACAERGRTPTSRPSAVRRRCRAGRAGPRAHPAGGRTSTRRRVALVSALRRSAARWGRRRRTLPPPPSASASRRRRCARRWACR